MRSVEEMIKGLHSPESQSRLDTAKNTEKVVEHDWDFSRSWRDDGHSFYEHKCVKCLKTIHSTVREDNPWDGSMKEELEEVGACDEELHLDEEDEEDEDE